MKNTFLLVFIASLSISCAQKQEEQKPSLLSDFWKQEIARLNKEKPMITKISTVNGKSDTIRTDSIDWEKELQIFVKNDLYEKDLALYNIDTAAAYDTLQVDDGEGKFIYKSIPTKKLIFTPKNVDQKIRNMTAYLVDKPYDRVEILIKDEEQLFGINKRMEYSRLLGYYAIEGSQNVKFLNGINYKVQVKFKE
ncbi:MAG: hypothetical protein ACO3EE_01585 [Flavobacteriales bacterium]